MGEAPLDVWMGREVHYSGERRPGLYSAAMDFFRAT